MANRQQRRRLSFGDCFLEMRAADARRMQVGREERLDPHHEDPGLDWWLEEDLEYCRCDDCRPALEEDVELLIVAQLVASLHRPFAGLFSASAAP